MNIELEIHVAGREPMIWHGRGSDFTIGRDLGCDLVFDDDDGARLVSGRHARLRVRDGTVFLADMGSGNGTFVTQRQLSGDVALRVGDRFTLGRNGPAIVVRRMQLPATTSLPSDASKPASARPLWLVNAQCAVSQVARKM